MTKPPIHGRDHKATGCDPIPTAANFQVIMFPDGIAIDTTTTVTLMVTEDMNEWHLDGIEAFCSTTAAGIIIGKATHLASSTDIGSWQIDSNEATTYTSSSPSATDTSVLMTTGDLIQLIVTSAGNRIGLGVALSFRKS